MRTTRLLRCLRCGLGGSALRAFWSLNLFASQASLDAYRADARVLAADKAKATLITTAVLQSLGWTNAVATTSPPGTVTLKDGTVGYGAHNLIRWSEDTSNAAWSIFTGASKSGANVLFGADTTSKVIADWAPSGSEVSQPWTIYAKVVGPVGGKIRPEIIFQGITTSIGADVVFNSSGVAEFAYTGVSNATVSGISFGVLNGTDSTAKTLTIQRAALLRGTYTLQTAQDAYTKTTSAVVYAPRLTCERGATSNWFARSQSDPGITAAGSSPPTLGTYTDSDTGIVCETVTFPAGGGGYSVSRATMSLSSFAAQTGAWAAWWEIMPSADCPISTAQTYVQSALVSGGSEYSAGTLLANRWNTQLALFTSSGMTAPNLTIYRGTDVLAAPLTLKIRRRVLMPIASIAGLTAGTNVPIPHAVSTYLRTFSTAPLYTAGTPRSQNLATGSGTQSITVVPGCVYTVIHQAGGTYTLSGAGSGTTTAAVATTVVATTSTLTLTVSSAPTLLQVYEGTATLAYVAGPYSEYPLAGLLREEGRTNSIRNSTMVGAAAGSPGALPTNWSDNGIGTLTRTIATGTDEAGRPYLDLRLSGTTSTTTYTLFLDGIFTPGTSGQSWVSSFYHRIAAGSLANITGVQCVTAGYTAAPALTEFTTTAIYPTAANARASNVCAMANGTIAKIANAIFVVFSSGVAIDVTLRLSAPQLELGAFPTSYIPTAAASVTRSADLIRPPTTYINDTAQTTVVEFISTAGITGSGQALLGRAGGGLAAYVHGAGGAAIYDGTNVVNTANVIAANVPSRLATRYSAGGIGATLNGGAIVSGSFDGTEGTSGATVGIGDDGAGNTGLSGGIRRIAIKTSAANDADLQLAASGGR